MGVAEMRHRAIAADPPWQEHGGGKSVRGCQRHYPTLSKKEILTTMLGADAWRPDKSGCHLWMWATSNFLPDALWLMQCLGFEYKSSAVWVKMFGNSSGRAYPSPIEEANEALQIGLGQYMRHAHEWLLLGTMGKAMVPEPANRVPSVIFAPRTKHSVKPQEAYDMIESTSPGPYLEMFARDARPGWDVWGNEAP